MDPNQQPNQLPQTPSQPTPGVQPPVAPFPPTPQVPVEPAPVTAPTTTSGPTPAQPYIPPAVPAESLVPQPPTAYAGTQQTNYDPNYLDSIAPPPPRSSFLSGTFGKVFYIMIGLFVLGVSLIVAFSGKNNTADLQQIDVRINNFVLIAKTIQPELKSNNLKQINSNFQIWLTNATHDGDTLLQQGGVKKTQYDKTMVASEKKISDDLTSKFEDSRLNAVLDRVYARTMAQETQKLISLYSTMSKKSASKQIRDYAKNAGTNLGPIQQSFDKYIDDGN